LIILLAIASVLLLESSAFFYVAPVSSASAGPNVIVKISNSSAAGYVITRETACSCNLSVSGSWVIPTVDCISASNLDYQVFVENSHIYEGSNMQFSCSGYRATPVYSMGFCRSSTECPTSFPKKDTISPGDKMSTVASLSSTGKVSITIKDSTKGWTATLTGTDTTTSSCCDSVVWYFYGPANTVVVHFLPMNTSGDSATFGKQSGSLGYYVPLPKYDVYEYNYTNFKTTPPSTIMYPTPVSSSGTSFNVVDVFPL